MFQGKRIKYAFTGTSRDALFDELEAQISTLRDILSDTDQVSALSQVEAKAPLQKVSKALLQFWSHADVIFKLLRDAWQCNCQSLHCANLWLQHRTSTMVDMQIRLTYCPGSSKISSPPWLYQSIDIRLQDPPLVQYTSSSIVVTTIDANAIKTSHTYAVGRYFSASEEVQPPTASVAAQSQIA
ncbi:hypothetical protein LTR48_008135 [Friedmanniomyces endolithicus]|nr:hypothetical protein LTR48_008135 [Friedmanniomyces endolithicus]